MQFKIYQEQLGGGSKTQPFNYMPDDIVYRFPWFLGDVEPPLSVLYPLLLKTKHGEVIDPLTIYIGRTASKKPFAYNPRHVVNPLVLIVGTPGSGKSLHPDERILIVRDGKAMSVPIKDVKVGDLVVSVTPDMNVRISRVLDVISHHHRGKLLRIRTKSGREVVVTPDHSIVTVKDGCVVSVKASDLSSNDVLLLPRWISPTFVEELDGIKLTQSIGYILGIYVTKGNIYNDKNVVHIHNLDSATRERLLFECRKAGVSCREHKKYIRIESSEIVRFILKWFDAESDVRMLPLWVLFSPLEFRRAFIAGLFDGGGYITLKVLKSGKINIVIEYYTTNKELADILALLLLFTGLSSYKRVKKVKNINHNMYRIYVADKLEFVEQIPAEKLKFVKDVLIQYSWRFLEQQKKVKNMKDFIIFDRIEKIDDVEYEGLVYDISTEDETFMTYEGIFVHNSATIKTFIANFLQNEYLAEGFKMPPVIVVDPEGEYAVLKNLVKASDVLELRLGRRDYINIFDRPSKSINPLSWYMRMLTVVQKFLYISPAQAAQAYRVLKRAILDLAEKRGFTADQATWLKPDITLEDVYNWIMNLIDVLEKKKKMEPAERIMYRGALTLSSRLDTWMQPPNDAFSKRSTIELSKMLNYKLVILDCRGLARELFGLFSYWITYWIYGLLLEKGPLPAFGIRVVLAIDEAWALLRKTEEKEENPLEALARRGRKYGILLILATQTPEDVDKKVFSLFGTLAIGNIPSDEMRKKLVESRGMPERFKDLISQLPQGTLVWHLNWRQRNFSMSAMPIIVHTEYPIPELIQVQP